MRPIRSIGIDVVAVGIAKIGAEFLEHFFGDQLTGVNPHVDQLVVAFQRGQGALVEAFLDAVHLLLGSVDDLVLGRRHPEIRDAEGQSAQRTVLESDVFDAVEQIDGFRAPQQLVTISDHPRGSLGGEWIIIKRHLRRQNLVEQQTSHGRHDQVVIRNRLGCVLVRLNDTLSPEPNFDLFVHGDTTEVICEQRFLRVVKPPDLLIFDRNFELLECQVVDAEHDVL